MKRLILIPIALAGIIALSACGIIGPQAKAGLTVADIEWCGEHICSVNFSDGKEKRGVNLSVESPSGLVVKYSASDVAAFKAHEVRGAVEQAISADVKETAPGLVDAVVKALTGK